MRSLKFLLPLAAVLLAAALLPLYPSAAAPPEPARPVAGVPDDGKPVVHLFEWKWADVARECTEVLGPKGFGGVQISPPQEHLVAADNGYPWWQRYQPVSYQVASRSGNREQFAAMVNTCHQSGVKIYADSVINHMSGFAGGTGSAGTQFTKYDYPGTYGDADFHGCRRDIQNWDDRKEVQECELVSLSDLNTSAPAVQDKIAGYLNDLTSLGVDGFRIDAAKHMAVDDIRAIEAKLSGGPYIYQEVFLGAGAVQPPEYLPTGDVQEFRFGQTIGDLFKNQALAEANTRMHDASWLPGPQAVTFVDNHDTQRDGGGGVLTHKDGKVYTLANVFQLAWDYGTPLLMSSFTFTERDAGPPSDGAGNTNDVSCGNGWECEHRQRPIANMVGFHNTVAGTPVGDWWSNGNDQIAFSRSGKGFVAINREDGELSRTFDTALPAGTYCDIVHGEFAGGSCDGPTVTVDGSGRANASVAGMDALAIHVGARVG